MDPSDYLLDDYGDFPSEPTLCEIILSLGITFLTIGSIVCVAVPIYRKFCSRSTKYHELYKHV